MLTATRGRSDSCAAVSASDGMRFAPDRMEIIEVRSGNRLGS
jgi:hypothetical protein